MLRNSVLIKHATSHMVANIKTEKDDMKGLPMFDSTNVVNRSKR